MFVSLLGNSTLGLYVCSANFSFSLDFEVDGCELDDEDGSFEIGFDCADIGGLDTERLKTGTLKPGCLLAFQILECEQYCIILVLYLRLHEQEKSSLD